jgi:3-oxoacyl-[acyl-carrier protein] reductase
MPNLTFNFAKQTVIITGAARGVGLELARFFAEAGANVVAVDFDGDVLTSAVADFNAVAIQGDVSSTVDVQRVVDATIDKFGQIDILVNNAGILRDGVLWKMTDEDWDAVLAVHAGGTFKFTRACVPHFRARSYGRIINVTSYTGLRGNTGQAVRASSSVPAVFQPVTINGLEYVDGGLASPVPAALARRMGADVVIAVDVSSRPSVQPLGGSIDLLLQTFAIMGQSIAAHELRDADVVIRPALGSTKGTDFAARHLSILEGETAASAQLGAIRQAIANARERLKGPQRALRKTG